MKRFVKILVLALLAVALGGVVMHFSSPGQANENTFEDIYCSVKGLSFDELEHLGDDFFMNGRLDSAAVCFTVIASNYDKSDGAGHDGLFARTFNKLGHLAILQANYTQAYSYFLKAIGTGDKHEGNKAKIYMSVIYGYYDDYSEFMKYLKEAYDYAIREKDFEDFLTIYYNMTNTAFAYDQLPSVADMVYSFDKINGISGMPLYPFMKKHNEAMIEILQCHYGRAINCFVQAKSLLDGKDRFAKYIGGIYENIGKCHALDGDYGQAISNMMRANMLAEECDDMVAVVKNMKYITDYYYKLGDTANADHCKLRYLEMSDSMFTIQNFKFIRGIEADYQIEQVQEQLARTQAEKHTQETVVRVVSGVAIVIVVLVFFIFRQNRIIRQANEDLYRKNVELMKRDEKVKTVVGQNEEEMKKQQSSRVYEAVIRVMEQSDDVYLPDFSIDKLSELVGYNSKYVSKAINDMSGKNFRTFLAEYRVREAQRRLTDRDNFDNYTNEAIGEQVGFCSRSNFIATFKKITGLTPKEYQRRSRFQESE